MDSKSTMSANIPVDKDSYTMQAKCINCGWSGTQSFSRGVIASNTLRECPGCGCLATLHFSPARRYKYDTGDVYLSFDWTGTQRWQTRWR